MQIADTPIADGIPSDITQFMSEAEKYRLSRMLDLLTEGTSSVDSIYQQMQDSINDDLATAKAALQSVESGMLASIQADIDVGVKNTDSIGLTMTEAINALLESAIDSIVATGQSPIMSGPEKQFYKTMSPAEAYSISKQLGDNIVDETMPIDDRYTKPVNLPPYTPPTPIGTGTDATIPPVIDGLPIYTPPVIDVPDSGTGIDNPTSPPISPPGKITCYQYIANADGSTTSLAVYFPIGSTCPPGYYDKPYVKPATSPPVLTPTTPPTLHPSNVCSQPVTVPGQVVWIRNTTQVVGGRNVVEYVILWPEQGKPSGFTLDSTPNPALCYQSANPATYVLPNANACNWPLPPPPTGTTPPPPPMPETPCPPGCVRIDSPSNPNTDLGLACNEWDNPITVCDAWKYLGVDGTDPTPPQVNTGTNTISYLQQLAAFTITAMGSTVGAIPSVFSSMLMGDGNNIILEAINSAMSAGFQSAVSIADSSANACKKNLGTMLTNITEIALAGWSERLSCAPVTYLAQDKKYALQFQLPQYLPTQSEIDNMHLATKINFDQWRCYTKALGNLPYTHQLNMETKRSRIDPRQALFLKRYKYLKPDDYTNVMKSLGFINKQELTEWEASIVALPGMSDITRFMVRDVEDASIVAQYELDKEFDKKYVDGGKLKLWAESQGIPEDVAKYYWRAHWEYPSNTALYEMIRRLRPGRNPEGLTVTKTDALKLMEINDIAPYWREKLLAISYAVLTRTDLKRGYNIDAIERKDVLEYLQDEGYEKKDAEQLAKVFDNEKDIYNIAVNQRTSAFTAKQIANAVANAEMTEKSARSQLETIGYKEKRINALIESARAKAQVISNKKCLKSIKSQFFHGIINGEQARAKVTALGIDQSQVNFLSESWGCEYAALGKDVPASKNVEWYVRGIIDVSTLKERLKNLHYNDDATNEWITEAVQKRSEAFIKAAKALAAEELKLRKAQQAALLAATKQKIAESELACIQECERNSTPSGSTP